MAYQSPAPTGLYLSNFLEAYLRSRQLGNQERLQSQGEIVNALHGLDLLKEQQVGQDIESLIRTRQAPPGAALAPQAGLAGPPPPAPGLAPGALGTPTIPEGIQVPQPGGRAGTLLEAGGAAPRSTPFEAITQGLPPAAVARLMTTGRGQTALKTLEQAERDKRTQEDQAEAETLSKEANAAANAGEPLVWADKSSAMFRRLKQFDRANEMAKYAIDYRQKKDQQAMTQAYFKAVTRDHTTYWNNPSPATLATFMETISAVGEDPLSQALAQHVLQNMVSKVLSKDPAEHFFDHAIAVGYKQAVDQNQKPDIPAIWRQAIAAQPAGFASILQKYRIDPKKFPLPDFLLAELRLPKLPVERKERIYQTAIQRVDQMPDVVSGRIPRDSAQYNMLIIQEEGRLTELGEGPTKHSVNVLREEALKYEKGVREGTIPVDLKQARLLLDQINTALRGGELDPDSEADLRRIQPGLVAAIEAAAKRSGIKVQPKEGPAGVPPRQSGKSLTTQQQTLKARRDALVQGNFPGKTWATLTPEEKQTIADLIEGQTRP